MSINQERMDAMTPNGSTEEAVETPAALRMLATSLASQVELGIVIEQAHLSEMRAHRNTQRRLDRANGDRERLSRFNLELLEKQELIRKAAGGEAEPTKTGDVLAEVRELWARAYSLELELLNAKGLLERAIADPEDDRDDRQAWETERAKWQESVREILLPQPELELEPELGQEYDRRPVDEEAKGESHS